jgi:hypothetical protein
MLPIHDLSAIALRSNLSRSQAHVDLPVVRHNSAGLLLDFIHLVPQTIPT